MNLKNTMDGFSLKIAKIWFFSIITFARGSEIHYKKNPERIYYCKQFDRYITKWLSFLLSTIDSNKSPNVYPFLWIY